MGMQLYDLAGADLERRFSPYCWRIKLALMHKGLPFDTIPWRFTEKRAIAFSGQGRVPVLIDGDQVDLSMPGRMWFWSAAFCG
jgi:glutathione S-transferase